MKTTTIPVLSLACLTLTLTLRAQDAPPAPPTDAPPPVVVGSGPLGDNGASHALQDFMAFIMPNPSNGLFNASEFDLQILGTMTHVDVVNEKTGKTQDHRTFGADVGLAYWFTTGLGSRFDISYADGQARYTSLAGVARTTFGTTNDLVMISPYTVLGAQHGIGDNTASFNGYAGLGVTIPFAIPVGEKKLRSRWTTEVDFNDKGKPNLLFGLEFDWQR